MDTKTMIKRISVVSPIVPPSSNQAFIISPSSGWAVTRKYYNTLLDKQ